MLERRAAGELPAKPHTALYGGSGGLRYEECITRAGFDGPYSIVYHERRPHEADPCDAAHGWALLGGPPQGALKRPSAHSVQSHRSGDAELAITDIRARGKRPIVCGGTFLWVRALIHGLVPAPPADAGLRARHQARVTEVGRAGLHEELARVDPEAAQRLAPNDFVRVSRALEVYELTGVRMSEWQAQHGFKTERHTARLLGVKRDKDELDVRIRERCQAMLAAGWVDEARDLAARGYLDTRPFASVGYKQVALALQGGAPMNAAELELSIYRATRVFARRQRTWLRDQPVEWLPLESTKL